MLADSEQEPVSNEISPSAPIVGIKAVLLLRNERLGVKGSNVRFEANKVEDIFRDKNSGRVSDSDATRKMNAVSFLWLALDGRRTVVGLYGKVCEFAIVVRLINVQRTGDKSVLMLDLNLENEC